jgi:hypothetical protein
MLNANKYHYRKKSEQSFNTVYSTGNGKIYNQTYHLSFINAPEIIFKFSLQMALGFEAGGNVYTGAHRFPISIENVRTENEMYARQLAQLITDILNKPNYKQYRSIGPNTNKEPT